MVQSWRDNTFFFLSEIKLIIFSYAPSNWHSFIHSFRLSFFPPFSPALSLAFSFSLSYTLYDNGCNNNCYCDVKRNTLTLCERARLSRNLINCHALRALLIHAQNYGLMCKNFASNNIEREKRFPNSRAVYTPFFSNSSTVPDWVASVHDDDYYRFRREQ